MFNKLQKFLLNKAIAPSKTGAGPKGQKTGKTKAKKRPTAQPTDADFRTPSAVALDDAVAKLENSGHKMDDMLAEHENLLAQVKAEAAKKMTPERRALLDSVQRVRASKAKILDDLDDETRARLYLTALRAFTGKQ